MTGSLVAQPVRVGWLQNPVVGYPARSSLELHSEVMNYEFSDPFTSRILENNPGHSETIDTK